MIMRVSFYLYIGLQEVYPVQVPDVEGEDVPVLMSKLLPELVSVIMAPFPAVGSEWLKRLLTFLHHQGDLDQEGLLTHQPVDQVHQLGWAIVKPKLRIQGSITVKSDVTCDIVIL